MHPLARATALCAAASLLALPAAGAQVRDTHAVTWAAAQKALAAAEAEARKNGWNMSIAVVDAAGELVAFERMDGAPPSSVDLSRAKARTAARMRRPTKTLEDAVTGGRLVLLGVEGIITLDGGVPIVVNGEFVGAVGCSGASSAQDGQAAQAGVNAIVPAAAPGTPR